MPVLKSLLQALGHLFSPRVCRICGTTLAEGEEVMCLNCLLSMPRTHFHRNQFNELHKRLGPGIPLDRVASWFFYNRHSDYARLIIDTKYGGRPKQGRKLGRMYARELLASGFFTGIDAMVPIPMHWTKRLMRGYNQTEEICRGISQATGIPVACLLKAPVSHGVQSRHTPEERAIALKGTFAATRNASDFDGRHLLAVDDIITTGATMNEALQHLHSACPNATLSVLSLAATHQ